MAPAIMPGAQMRRPAAAVRGERGRNLRDIHLQKRCLHDHLAGKFHPAGTQPHALIGSFAKAAHAAMKITARSTKEHPANRREHRIAKVTVQRRHRIRFDAAHEAVTHHQIGACSQLLKKRGNVAEVVAIIGIGHDHEAALSRGHSASQGAAVSLGLDLNDSRSTISRNLLRAVGRAIIHQDDLFG